MPSSSRNGSPSISMRSAKVPLSPSSALQTMYFRGASASAQPFHLIPAGKPAQSGLRDLFQHRGRTDRARALQCRELRQHGGIDDAAAREDQPRLALEPG